MIPQHYTGKKSWGEWYDHGVLVYGDATAKLSCKYTVKMSMLIQQW